MKQRWFLRVVAVAAFITLCLCLVPARLPISFRRDLFANDVHTPFDSWNSNTHRLSLPELRKLVKGKKGYYVRDWSVGLGWNNVRRFTSRMTASTDSLALVTIHH